VTVYICSVGSMFPQRRLVGKFRDVTLTIASQSSVDCMQTKEQKKKLLLKLLILNQILDMGYS